MIKIDVAKAKDGLSKAGQKTLISGLAVAISLVLSMAIVYFMDIDPLFAFRNMIQGALGSKNAIAETMVKMSPLLFTGMSYAMANRCGLVNLGMEGQLYIGALSATAVAVYVQGLPAFLHAPAAILAGFIGGALWGWFAGYLKVASGASEIITTVMMNTIAINFAAYMVAGPMAEPTGFKTQTPAILATSKLPRILEGTRVHLGFIIAIAVVILFWLFLSKSKKGFEVRLAGHNMQAALYTGINARSTILLVMALSGGLAGLAGANEILGVQNMMLPVISPGYGFDGIAVAMIGMNSPFGIVVGAFLFGLLRAGGNMMQMRAKVPISIISVIQGFVIIMVVTSNIVIEKWNDSRLKAKTGPALKEE